MILRNKVYTNFISVQLYLLFYSSLAETYDYETTDYNGPSKFPGPKSNYLQTANAYESSPKRDSPSTHPNTEITPVISKYWPESAKQDEHWDIHSHDPHIANLNNVEHSDPYYLPEQKPPIYQENEVTVPSVITEHPFPLEPMRHGRPLWNPPPPRHMLDNHWSDTSIFPRITKKSFWPFGSRNRKKRRRPRKRGRKRRRRRRRKRPFRFRRRRPRRFKKRRRGKRRRPRKYHRSSYYTDKSHFTSVHDNPHLVNGDYSDSPGSFSSHHDDYKSHSDYHHDDGYHSDFGRGDEIDQNHEYSDADPSYHYGGGGGNGGYQSGLPPTSFETGGGYHDYEDSPHYSGVSSPYSYEHLDEPGYSQEEQKKQGWGSWLTSWFRKSDAGEKRKRERPKSSLYKDSPGYSRDPPNHLSSEPSPYQRGQPSYESGPSVYQGGRPSYQSGPPVYSRGRPYQSGPLVYSSGRPSYQSSPPVYSRGRPSYQSDPSVYQRDSPSYDQTEPTLPYSYENEPPFREDLEPMKSRRKPPSYTSYRSRPQSSQIPSYYYDSPSPTVSSSSSLDFPGYRNSPAIYNSVSSTSSPAIIYGHNPAMAYTPSYYKPVVSHILTPKYYHSPIRNSIYSHSHAGPLKNFKPSEPDPLGRPQIVPKYTINSSPIIGRPIIHSAYPAVSSYGISHTPSSSVPLRPYQFLRSYRPVYHTASGSYTPSASLSTIRTYSPPLVGGTTTYASSPVKTSASSLPYDSTVGRNVAAATTVVVPYHPHETNNLPTYMSRQNNDASIKKSSSSKNNNGGTSYRSRSEQHEQPRETFSTLPDPSTLSNYKPDPAHENLPNLTYDGNSNQNLRKRVGVANKEEENMDNFSKRRNNIVRRGGGKRKVWSSKFSIHEELSPNSNAKDLNVASSSTTVKPYLRIDSFEDTSDYMWASESKKDT